MIFLNVLKILKYFLKWSLILWGGELGRAETEALKEYILSATCFAFFLLEFVQEVIPSYFNLDARL